MKTLEEVKNEIAISRSFASWDSCVDWHIGNLQVVELMELLAKKHAKQCLQQAAERIKEKSDQLDDRESDDVNYKAGLYSAVASIRQLLKELE